MKPKYILFVSLFFTTTLMFPQSNMPKDDKEGHIYQLTKRNRELVLENDSLKRDVDYFKNEFEKCQTYNSEIKNKVTEFENRVNYYEEQKGADDFLLLNSCSFYIRFPFNESIIEQVAIPAFKAIKNEEIKKEYDNRLTLLEHYKEDTESLLSFLKNTHEELNGFFSVGLQVEKINEMKKLPLYYRYKNTQDSYIEKSYIGKAIIEIERRLKEHLPDNNANFEDIINELQKAIDS